MMDQVELLQRVSSYMDYAGVQHEISVGYNEDGLDTILVSLPELMGRNRVVILPVTFRQLEMDLDGDHRIEVEGYSVYHQVFAVESDNLVEVCYRTLAEEVYPSMMLGVVAKHLVNLGLALKLQAAGDELVWDDQARTEVDVHAVA